MTTIRARLYGTGESVTATGTTLPAAVRSAARLLGLGPGRTVSRTVIPEGWEWDWSGHRLIVLPVAPIAGEGKRIVSVTLSPAAIAQLDTMAHERGLSRSACVEALIRAAPMPRPAAQRPE